MAYPLIYPALEWLLGIGATGAGVAASNNEEVPVSSWSLHDNPVGRGLHWLFDPKWGGFATAMTYSPTTIERMPDGSYFGYQSWNNPDGTFGSEIRPNTLGTVTVMSRPRYSVISSRLYDEAPADSVSATPANPTAPTDSVGSTPTAAPGPEPERNDSTSQRRPSFRERLRNRIAGRKPPKNGWQQVSRYLWETKNNNLGPNNWGLRNLGRVVLYGGKPTREFLGNHARDWFLGTDSIPTQQPAGSTTTANPSSVTNPTDTLPAVSNQQLPDSTVVNANSDWEEWLKSRGTE